MPKKIKILIIDDEEDFVFFARENLIRKGMFEVFIATNGRYGIELAAREQPDIVLLDLVMPDMPGEEVADALQQNAKTAAIPILYITALATENDLGTNPVGTNHLLAKPVRTKTLVDTICGILRHPQPA